MFILTIAYLITISGLFFFNEFRLNDRRKLIKEIRMLEYHLNKTDDLLNSLCDELGYFMSFNHVYPNDPGKNPTRNRDFNNLQTQFVNLVNALGMKYQGEKRVEKTVTEDGVGESTVEVTPATFVKRKKSNPR